MRNHKGTVLILTFIVMTTLTAIASAFLYMTSVQLKGSGYDVASSKAIWLAEAGLQQVIYNLKNDANYRNNPTPVNGNLGAGSYTVTVSKNDTTYTLSSLGTVDVLNRRVTQTAIVANGVLTRAIHADGSTVDFASSAGTINGNISCHVQVKNYGGMTINGTITQNMDKIEPELDFDYYKGITPAGQLKTVNFTFQNATYNGIWYVTKKATIGNNAIINGSIFADNGIEFSNKANNVQVTPSSNYPALASKSTITSTDTGPSAGRIGLQNSTVNGLVFAENNITFNYLKSTTFNGTILAVSNISMQSGSPFAVNYNANIFSPMPPGFTLEGDGGGDITVTPQKDWDEIVPAI